MSPGFYQAMRAVTDKEGRYLFPELANRHPTADGTFTWQGMRVSLDPNYQAPVLGTAGTNKGSRHHRRPQGLRNSEHRWHAAVSECLGR